MRILTRIVFLIGFLVIFASGNQVRAQDDFPDIIFHFHGPETNSAIGQSITGLGDINDDGFTDIAVSSSNPRGIYIFLGGDPPDSIPDQFIPGQGNLGNPIDIDGDGRIELITSDLIYEACEPTGESGRFYFYSISDGLFSDTPIDSLAIDTSCRILGPFFKSGYVDGDPYGDILSYYGNKYELSLFKGNLMTRETLDWSFSISDYQHQYTPYCFDFIDFNGDGIKDISLGLQALHDSISYVYLFYGPDYGAAPSLIIEEPEFIKQAGPLYVTIYPIKVQNISDYNGDGWEDLGVSYVCEGEGGSLIYLGGPGADSLYDYQMINQTDFMSSAGDLNGDGYNDLACGGAEGYSSYFYIYSGGPHTDDQPDAIVQGSHLPPVFLTKIGYRMAPIGDFNGDGLDDLLFSCLNFVGNPGDVFILAGTRLIPSDVDEDPEIQIPDKIELHQNYPNPFNSGTVIGFNLHQSEHIRLAIYNVIGQEVRILKEGYYFAGYHEFIWNGKNMDGEAVSSGTYFYRLNTQNEHYVGKAILIK